MKKILIPVLGLLLIIVGCATAPCLAAVARYSSKASTCRATPCTLFPTIAPLAAMSSILPPREGALQLDTCNQFFMVLTDHKEFAAANLSKDRSFELKKVEK